MSGKSSSRAGAARSSSVNLNWEEQALLRAWLEEQPGVVGKDLKIELVKLAVRELLRRQPKTPPHAICDNCGEETGDKTKPITEHFGTCIMCMSGLTQPLEKHDVRA